MRISDWSSDVCSVDLVRGIYDRFGWDFTPATEAGVLGWLAENPAGKHGKHKYSLEEFGLNEQAVRDVYADYIETYREYIVRSAEGFNIRFVMRLKTRKLSDRKSSL